MTVCTWLAVKHVHLLPWKIRRIIDYGHVKEVMIPSLIFWTIYLLDLTLYKLCVLQSERVAFLFMEISLFCYERNFILSHPEECSAEAIEAFNSTSKGFFLG